MSEAILRLDNLQRGFHQGSREQLHVLNGANLSLNRGEVVALVGPSGAGKSTLLHIAGLLEFPDQGEVWLSGEACGKLSDDRRTAIRRRVAASVDFRFTDDDLAAALSYQLQGGYLMFTFDPDGASKWYQATRAGIDRIERGITLHPASHD